MALQKLLRSSEDSQRQSRLTRSRGAMRTQGNGMVKMDVTGLCDPYVALTVTNNDGVGGKTRKTQFIRQNINPEWNAAFTFEVTSPSQILVVRSAEESEPAK